ncbi:alpha-ketoacid dehydrogenase subunit beta [Alkalihalobacterium alkalinitrilicum]|uniref:alpha-ketoacid dehydrogenase subunit beta n=1 Tax=Alkalihalobacterium alkalinitrilicum TaxID=427920 RepID=UPI0009951936|nr:alpha-ketoacid dehydrogenase subunit beta [Alkalihalobacterium alkalinitrilicum]
MTEKLNLRWALNHALDEEMARDKKVFLMGEDIGKAGGTFGITRGLYEKYGDLRVKDTPISEEGIMGAAVGAALVGYRPIVDLMFMDFITIAMEQLANQAAKTYYFSGGKIKVPLVVRALAGGGFRAGGHHSQTLESWFTHVPGLKVVYPSTPYDAKGLLKASIRDDNPVVFLEHKSLLGLKGAVPSEEYVIPLGKADIKREGKDVTIVTFGRMIHTCLEAAKELSELGIEAEVVDPRTLLPLDKETIIQSVQKTNRVMIVQEAPLHSGFGAEIAAMISEEAVYDLDAPIKRVAGAFTPIPVGKTEDFLYPSVSDIVLTAKSLVD